MPTARRIAAIAHNPRDPVQVEVRVGEGAAARTVARLTAARCAELGLRPGQAWTDALARKVHAAAALDAAREDAFARLARRAMTQEALRLSLVRAGHAASAAAAAVDDLASSGWLNDSHYAERRAEALAGKAPHSRRAIGERLEREGVAQEIARKAAAGATQRIPTEDLAEEARAARLKGVPLRTIAARLARRGWEQDEVHAALRSAGYPMPEE